MQVFSSTGLSGDDAFERWRTAICRQFVPLRPEPTQPMTSFFGELYAWPIGPLTLTDIRSTGQRVYRGAPEISRSRAEAFFLNLQIRGHGGLSTADMSAATCPGDLFLVDANRPFMLACETPMRHVCLAVPRTLISRPDSAHGLLMRSGDNLAGLLGDYLCALVRSADQLGGAADDVADHLLALMDHALSHHRPCPGSTRNALRSALFAKACRVIDHGLRSPGFDPTNVARSLRVSLRYLQALFAEQGTSVMREIVQRRTSLAVGMLRDPAYRSEKITSIAFACGFRDLSHFGRCVVARTGETPRAWRQSCSPRFDRRRR
jgi:AraC-like DNA-binding protein